MYHEGTFYTVVWGRLVDGVWLNLGDIGGTGHGLC